MTTAQIRCLLALKALNQLSEEVASKDIAHLVGISRPSVHRLLEALSAEGLIAKEPYGTVELTAKGCETAHLLEERKERLTLLFARHFGLPMDEGATAAILLMSGLREDSLTAMEAAASRN